MNNSGPWVGLITAPPPPKVMQLKLDVYLYLTAALPTKYAGILELYEPKSIIVKRLVLREFLPIKYVIQFPLVNPLPTVKNITFNGKTLCLGPKVIAPVVTTIHLEHTLYPPLGTMEQVPARPPNIIPNGAATRINLGPEYVEDNEECGRAIKVNPLIIGGSSIERGSWPWLVAVYMIDALGIKFHCSGTLITSKHVITAAHCVSHDSTGVLTEDSVFIYLGKFNLKQWTEPGSVLKPATKISIHPDYNRSTYSADIAVIEFEAMKAWTNNIRPACLWSRTSKIEPFLGQTGMIAGWGHNIASAEKLQIPHSLQVPVVSQEECIRSFSDFRHIMTEQSLCAGSRNGTGPCNGDSGSGLLMLNTNTYQWELRAIVSISLLNATAQTCDLTKYFLLTDVAKYRYWILSLME
ncbi:serine protease gd [Nilaparvata lugens]|nr:serine protease gd [Nilaparvata lugens]